MPNYILKKKEIICLKIKLIIDLILIFPSIRYIILDNISFISFFYYILLLDTTK